MSTLECTVAYMRDLIKERDRLTTNLGCRNRTSAFMVDMGNLIPEGTGEEDEVVSDEDDNHFLSNSANPHAFPTEGMAIQTEDVPCVGYPTDVKTEVPCDPATVKEKAISEASQSPKKSSIDYKGIWVNNSMPSLIVQINSGKLLKGNNFFMKWEYFRHVTPRLFQFASMEQLNQLSFFDIISPDDLSLFWRWLTWLGADP